MNLLTKIKEAGKDYLKGYKSERYLVNNINKEKGKWVYENEDKFIENVKITQKNNFTKWGSDIYFLINPLKGSEYVSFMLNYRSQHPNLFKEKDK